MQSYFETRKQMELRILKAIDVEKLIIDVDIQHPEEVADDVIKNIVDIIKK